MERTKKTVKELAMLSRVEDCAAEARGIADAITGRAAAWISNSEAFDDTAANDLARRAADLVVFAEELLATTVAVKNGTKDPLRIALERHAGHCEMCAMAHRERKATDLCPVGHGLWSRWVEWLRS